MRYQHKWSDIEWSEVPDEGQKNLQATIHRSVELGINHIETARGYGSSEMQLGPVLKQFPREELIVQTKVAPFASPKKFLDTFNTSMDYLQLDYVELLSLHGINNQELLDWSLARTAAWPPRASCKRKAAAGTSVSPPTPPRISSESHRE